MSLALYNTLTRQVEPFTPRDPNMVKLYACGPTVYNYAHIGNLRTYIHEDILVRALTFNGHKVQHIMNITDVGHLVSDEDSGDDKMELGASKEGLSIWDLAAKYTAAFISDTRDLNILAPTLYCKATDHIAEQIKMVQKLEALGLTYRTSDGIYYDTAKFSDYGRLGGQNLEELQAGSRIHLSDEKRNITDFALWKFAPEGKQRLMEWESPWGRGFPGWHIECSAMATKYCGDELDIHCGGIDHIKIHHTNEIAQVEPITCKRWVNYWFHTEFLIERDGKMSKSSGEFLTLSLLKERGYAPLEYRYFVLNSHYRSKLNFSFDALTSAKQAYANLKHRIQLLLEAGPCGPADPTHLAQIREMILAGLNRDLTTPEVLAALWQTLKEENFTTATRLESLKMFDQVLGLDLCKIALCAEESIPCEVQALAQQREEARKARNFALADQLRAKISEHGYQLVDTKDGPKLKKGE